MNLCPTAEKSDRIFYWVERGILTFLLLLVDIVYFDSYFHASMEVQIFKKMNYIPGAVNKQKSSTSIKIDEATIWRTHNGKQQNREKTEQ